MLCVFLIQSRNKTAIKLLEWQNPLGTAPGCKPVVMVKRCILYGLLPDLVTRGVVIILPDMAVYQWPIIDFKGHMTVLYFLTTAER